MKKLEISCKTASSGCSCALDNTTRAMNMTRVKRTSKCMCILHEMIVHPRTLTAQEIKQKVYGHDIGKSCQGFFSALRHFSLADFVRDGHKCLWEPTVKGIRFYMGLT